MMDTHIEELFEEKADEAGFCLDKKWGDYSNPYLDQNTRLAFDFFKSGFLTSGIRSKEKLEGFVVVPINNTTIVAIEKMVEQQVEASGITEDVFRLDGEKILNAAVEAARGGNE